MSVDALAVEGILIADFTRGRTRAFLLDVVDGEHRFIAKGEAVSTIEPPQEDIAVSVQAAARVIEYVAGRSLLKRDRLVVPQVTNGDGVDAFLAVANVGDPLRLAVLDAGVGEADIAAVSEALRRTEALVLALVPPDRSARPAEWANQQAAALSTWQPHLVLLLAGTATTNENLPRMLGLLKSLAGPEVTTPSRLAEARAQLYVWVVASDAVYNQIADHLAARTNLRPLTNVPPAALGERLVGDLAKFIDERSADTVPGYAALVDWMNGPFVSRQQGAGLVTHYLARTLERRVALADLEEHVSLYWAWQERATAAVVPDVDLGVSTPNLLLLAKPTGIKRWLPFDVSDEELTHWALNRALRPQATPISLRDQLIEQAFAREALQLAGQRLPAGLTKAAEVLVGSCTLSRWHAPAAALVLIDGLQPAPDTGAITVALDPIGMLPALGALAQHEPAVAASVLEQDGLLALGTCLVIQGGNDGQRVASGRLQRASGESHDFEVRAGSLVCLPLAAEESASIRLMLEKGGSLGTFRSGQTVQFEAPTHVRGGQAGLIIDARGRPLHLPDEARRRQERLRDWLKVSGIVPGTGVDGLT